MVSTHLQKTGLSITQDLNRIKNLEHPFVNSGKLERCAKFQQKILNSMVVGTHQNFPAKWPGFSKVIELFLNLSGGFAHN